MNHRRKSVVWMIKMLPVKLPGGVKIRQEKDL